MFNRHGCTFRCGIRASCSFCGLSVRFDSTAFANDASTATTNRADIFIELLLLFDNRFTVGPELSFFVSCKISIIITEASHDLGFGSSKVDADFAACAGIRHGASSNRSPIPRSQREIREPEAKKLMTPELISNWLCAGTGAGWLEVKRS